MGVKVSDTLARSSSLFVQEEQTMKVCVEIDGKWHCWWIPLYQVQWTLGPDPGPEYTHVLTDATILGTIRSLSNQLASTGRTRHFTLFRRVVDLEPANMLAGSFLSNGVAARISLALSAR
jgi:hypothetical protein